MGKRKSRGRSSHASSKDTPPLISDHDNSPEPPPKKKKTSGPKSSSDLCAEYNVQDVELEYTDADYQNLTTYNLFVRLIRPQISAANPKFIPASKMNQIMEAKWREFTDSNPFSKDSKEEEDEDDDDDDIEETEEQEDEQVNDEDDEDIDEEEEKDEAKQTGSNTEEYDKSSDDSGPTKRKSKRKEKKEDYDKSSDDSGQTEKKSKSKEKKGGRKSTGSLKIKLSMSFGIRKSAREKKLPKKLDEDIEKFFDSDEESQDSSKEKKKTKKKKLSSEEEFESEDSGPKQKRRSGGRSTAKKRNKSPGTSSSSVSSSSTSDSDSDSSNEKSKKRRGRKAAKRDEKVVIPGERRSERSRKSASSLSLKEMTDREFEKMMLKQQEKKQKEKRHEDRKKKKKLKEDWKIKGKKGAWQDENELKSGEESDHCWFCSICKDGGDLMLCDGCPKSFHQKCLKIEEVPEGDWKCPICTGEGLPELSEEEEEDGGHDHFCKECKEGGDLLLCDFCPKAYHMTCLNPSLKEIPEGEWKCPRCIMADNPPKESIARILTWRWVNVSQSKDDELDHTMSPRKKSEIERNQKEDDDDDQKNEEKRPERELFVKFRYHSYWDCEWIPELMLEMHQQTTWRNFKKKWDQDEPPALDDGGAISRHHKKNEDPHNLNERYYRWGVKPDWLQIHRIVSHEKESSRLNKYLVKWRELAYEEATFEAEDDLPEGLQDWKKHVGVYWTRRKEKELKEKQTKKEQKHKPKKKELKKKLDKQPDYLDKTGGKLHPYQLEGLNWMRFSWSQDTNIILADEMGLGKTIQAIVFLRCLFREGYAPGPFLVSAPLSTVPNWEREFEFWAPDMYVVTYTGSKENRTIIRERDMCYKEGAFHMLSSAGRFKEGFQPKFDVLLTSYEMVNMDKATLKSIPYSVLVIDEAHRLKSNQSLFFRTMSEYKIDYKLLLTGTPLQNTLEELFNLLSFLEPQKFDNMEEFLNQFQDIGKEEQVKHLHDLLAPHMLRRLKMDVLKDIPDKCELIVRVELSALQKKYYKHILTRNFAALNVKGHGNQTSLINIMMDLRKCANHPYLFPTADQEAPYAKDGGYEGSALTKASGKLELLEKMLKLLKKGGHRVLIFSQMTRVLGILEDFMAYHQYNFERIDGSVTGGLRQERIDRFNDPESTAFAFLLSTKAGGLGINLATADTVIIYDMDWNPHNDIQAFSRAHRIGQKNKVMIYRFVCRNTVEEKMTQVCKSKMMLSELVIAKGGVEKKESLTKQEVNEILKFGAENLFKDTEVGQVIYDDDAVEKLLNRDQAGEAEKQFGMNEYLRSFNVATYKIKEGIEEEEEKEVEEEVEEEVVAPSKSNSVVSLESAAQAPEDDPAYWARVLGDSYADHLQQLEKEQSDIARSLGKGKRRRKQINYAETALMSFMSEKDKKKMMNVEVLEEDEDNDEQYMSDDYRPDDSSSSSEDEEVVDENLLDAEERKIAEMARRNKQYIKEQKELKKQRDKMKADKGKQTQEALPPLLAKVNGQIEVLGFTARQRRAFLDSVMRFGMPPEDVYKSQWLVRDLRMKNERVFKAYMSLFMRHLCEPVPEDADKFADGVPREGLSRQHVLTRIGMIALIRRKVSEYEKNNGMNSMDEFSVVQNVGSVTSLVGNLAVKSLLDNAMQKEAEIAAKKNEADDKTKDDKVVEQKAEVPEKATEGKEEDKMDVDSTENKTSEVSEEKKGETDQEKETSSEDKENEQKEEEAEEKMDTEESKEGEKAAVEKADNETKESDKDQPESKIDDNSVNQSKKSDKSVDGSKDKADGKVKQTDSDDVGEWLKETVIVNDIKEESESSPAKTQTKQGGDSSNKQNETSEKDIEKQHDISSNKQNKKETTDKIDETEERDKTSEKENDSNKKDGKEQDKDSLNKQIEKEETSQKVNETEKKDDENKCDNSSNKEKEETEEKDSEKAEEKQGDNSSNKENEKEVATKEKDGAKQCKDSSDKANEKEETKEKDDETKEKNDETTEKDDEGGKSSESADQSEEQKESSLNRAKETVQNSSYENKALTTNEEIGEKSININEENKGESSQKDTGEQSSTSPNKDSEKDSGSNTKDLKSSPDPKRVLYNGYVIKTLSEIQTELRKRCWLSDGGFTELHAVWNHEESLLIPGREWEMWHRRHDFWLLTGVITHGYRHWQDIMNDPRFEILNKAFRADADRLKRAAFLNRRFQLLEQALVIEEQLRKAAIENTSHFQAAIQEVKEAQGQDASKDLLAQVDQFAANLRKISHGMKVSGPPPDAKVHKAISTLSGLITDIRQITYKTMPSTLAMTEHGAQSAKQSLLAKQMQKEAAAIKVITVD